METFAVIGNGKTGSYVAQALGNRCVAEFGRSKPIQPQNFPLVDAIIAFVPGPAVQSLIPILMEIDKPVVWGSTDFEWPSDMDEQLKKRGLKWVHGQNFSIGMQVIRRALQSMSTDLARLDQASVHIKDIHHTEKLDAPSGTALKWQQWLGKEYPISSERVGDVRGIHELHIETAGEQMNVRHQAKDRSVFASGAIWAAEQLCDFDENGLLTFEYLFDKVNEHGI